MTESGSTSNLGNTPVKKILILSANPKTTARLRLDEEVREIKEGLKLSKYRNQFDIQSNSAVRLRDFRRTLLDYEPQIVHFTGHGNKEGLLVEDELGMAVRLSSKALSGLFELFSDKIECVILSACHSAPQANAISKHINHVIGMKDEIDDKAAIEFAVGFYDALGAGRSVEEAFKFGLNAILQIFPDLPEHLIPILKKKKGLEKQDSDIAALIPSKNAQLLPDFDSIKNRIQQCSKASILRAEERIPKIEVNGKMLKLIPIPRKDTSPNFERFIESDKPLLVIIGDSGSGKSTLLYRIAKKKSDKKFITLFYDVHNLRSTGKLTAKLAQDFRCDENALETILGHFDNILSKEDKKLLIIIDGLNESIKIDPSDLKIEIEDLATKLPRSIKIAYSCRTIYWKSYINAAIPSALYHNSKEFLLHFYSFKEAEKAFKVYQDFYKFKGTFKSLKDDFKEKLRDPLMMRMLAEGYKGIKLPYFAPAVKIFRNYEESLKQKFKGNPFLVDFLYQLISFKLEELNHKENVSDQFDTREIRANNLFSNYFKMLTPRDPIILLEDEGILNTLNADESVYRFTYDRFFEYLLGKEIGRNFRINSKDKFANALIDRIQSFQSANFSFIQALKSEIIRQNIINPGSVWSFYDTDTLKPLINHQDVSVVNLTKEILRELTFESEKDTLSALEGVTDDELSGKLLALDIAGDSPKSNPILIEGLFSGDVKFIRRCIQRLSVMNEDANLRKGIEDSIISAVSQSDLSQKYGMGLISYTAIIFSLEDNTGNDPFVYITKFWKKILNKINNKANELKKSIRIAFPIIVRSEAPKFFSSDTDEEGMDYFWTGMTQEIKDLALRMVPLIVNPDKLPDNELQRILNFFGSELKNWKNYDNPERSPIYTYRLEYRISQWILIQRSVKNYPEVKNIMQGFVDTDFWLSIDFALGTMQYILETIYCNRIDIIMDGFSTMKSWVEKFMKNEKFFDSFTREDDPFSITFNPLAQTTEIDALYISQQKGPIRFLEDKITSNNPRMARMALMAARQSFKFNPMKVLETFELILGSKDDVLNEWLEKVLKEMYNFYPRLVENFLEKNNLPPDKVHRIKFKTDFIDARGVEYSGTPLYKALFLRSENRRIIFANWYKKLLSAPNLDTFCGELSDYLFDLLQRVT